MPSPTPTPDFSTSNRPLQEDHTTDEAVIDKFATLFSPATPRASPTLEPDTTLPPKPHLRPRSSRQDVSSSDSEFGSFVSVSAQDDPLASIDDFDFDVSPPPAIPGSSTTVTNPHGSSSLSFFDKFAQDSKDAAERNKHDLLDELLMHEDDPLYWMRNRESTLASSRPATPPQQQQPLSDLASHNHLQDLDHDFFTSKPAFPPALNESRAPITYSPSRSSTLALPVTPAPPLADTSTASPSPPTDSSDPLSSTTTSTSTTTRSHSQSYSTLSGLSARWMSSLRSSKSTTSTAHTASPSLESLFAFDAANTLSASPRPKPTTTTTKRSQSPAQHPRSASHPTPIPSDVHISHGTPFARARSTKPSPFASHIYTPPSGAPGYRGEGYDWDRGFSAELERELGAGAGERELVDVGVDPSLMRKGKGVGKGKGREVEVEVGKVEVGVDVGSLIERRSGGVELLGRNASTTTPVLEVDLADMLRPHLPPLARLPRKWTLLYSLDQHGISLNTLYTRCEAAHTQAPAATKRPLGALVVVKDAGEAVFGVWVGKEGIRPGRGRGYYGSGDSFLWRRIGSKFQVFKWTGRNEYVALCEPGFISFGGGDGNYGLYLDDTLFSGSSASCPTFGNEPLCSPAGAATTTGAVQFECVGLEVWGVGP